MVVVELTIWLIQLMSYFNNINMTKILIDVYFKNKETGKFQIFHEVITEEDIERLAKEKTQDSLPMWMDENWEYESTNVDKVNL